MGPKKVCSPILLWFTFLIFPLNDGAGLFCRGMKQQQSLQCAMWILITWTLIGPSVQCVLYGVECSFYGVQIVSYCVQWIISGVESVLPCVQCWLSGVQNVQCWFSGVQCALCSWLCAVQLQCGGGGLVVEGEYGLRQVITCFTAPNPHIWTAFNPLAFHSTPHTAHTRHCTHSEHCTHCTHGTYCTLHTLFSKHTTLSVTHFTWHLIF